MGAILFEIALTFYLAAFFSWCIVFIFFFLQFRYRISLLCSFIMPIVFVLMPSSSMLPREIKPLSPVLQSHWLGIHTFEREV